MKKIFISSYLHVNDIFRKDMTCDNIKSHKKQGFTLSLQKNIFGKTTEGAVKLVKEQIEVWN